MKDYIKGGRPAKELKAQVSEDEVVKKKQASAEKNCAGAEAVVAVVPLWSPGRTGCLHYLDSINTPTVVGLSFCQISGLWK